MGIEGLIGLIVGIGVVVVAVALYIIFRKKIHAYFKNKSDAKAQQKATATKNAQADKAVVNEVFKRDEPKQQEEASVKTVSAKAAVDVNARNLSSQTIKQEEKVEKKEESNYNVMSQFNKKS